MARPGKGFFRKKSEASTNPEVRGEHQSSDLRERTGKPVKETLEATDLVWKGFTLLESGSVYPIVEESLITFRFSVTGFRRLRGTPDLTEKQAPSWGQ